jgi:hypothetical protein
MKRETQSVSNRISSTKVLALKQDERKDTFLFMEEKY